jgi:hypothetical protein
VTAKEKSRRAVASCRVEVAAARDDDLRAVASARREPSASKSSRHIAHGHGAALVAQLEVDARRA